MKFWNSNFLDSVGIKFETNQWWQHDWSSSIVGKPYSIRTCSTMVYTRIIDDVTNFMAVVRTFFIKYVKKVVQNFAYRIFPFLWYLFMVFIQFDLDLKWNFYKAVLQVALEIRSDRNVEINQDRLSGPNHQFHRKYNHLKNPCWNEMDQDWIGRFFTQSP